MALHNLALTMQVLANDDLLLMIMDNVDDPKTLFNFLLVLPTAKAAFERCPRQLLTAALSSLPSELQLLAILFITLKQDHVSRASMIPLLWSYLRLDDTPGSVEPEVAAVDFAMPKTFSNPFETLRKLAAVWSAVEDLAGGFVERSIEYIQTCKAAEAAGLETVPYDRGHKLRPLSHLWNREIDLDGLPGYQYLGKPQPWCLPLRASEIHRIKRALWQFEIVAVVSYEPHTFPKKSATELEAAEVYGADPIENLALPPGYDEGTRMLLASLRETELAEFDSVYDYLWCETIGRAYQHNLDSNLPQHGNNAQAGHAEGKSGTTSRDVEGWEQKHHRFHAQFAMKRSAERARKEHDHYLTYCMSLGLPFLHRVHQQIMRDGNDIIPKNYPPLRYRSPSGLRDTWIKMDINRCYETKRFYRGKLVHTSGNNSVIGRSDLWPAPEDTPGAGTDAAMYLQTRHFAQFRPEDLWRAGCYMWETGRRG